MASAADKIDNDPFPEDSTVLVWFPPVGADAQDRSSWAWLPGTVVNRCGPDEWYVVVELDELAEPDPTVPDGDAPENWLYPACFRDSTELRAVSSAQWEAARAGGCL